MSAEPLPNILSPFLHNEEAEEELENEGEREDICSVGLREKFPLTH